MTRMAGTTAPLARRALLGGGGGGQDVRAPHARVAEGCLARHGVVCQSCRDACPEGAISFRPTLGRVATPAIDVDACTGCGDCVAPCPVAAIDVNAQAAALPDAG